MLEIWCRASWTYRSRCQTTIAPLSAGLITISFLSCNLLMAFLSSLEVLLCIEVIWLFRMLLISIRNLDMNTSSDGCQLSGGVHSDILHYRCSNGLLKVGCNVVTGLRLFVDRVFVDVFKKAHTFCQISQNHSESQFHLLYEE